MLLLWQYREHICTFVHVCVLKCIKYGSVTILIFLLCHLCILHPQRAQADMGNTEVFRPLHAYFLLPPSEGTTRNVLLISDGHLNNEKSVLSDAANNYQHTRIFTFGVR